MTVLETDRLILRPPQQADLDGFAALMGDEQSARFIGGVMSRAAAWRGMASIAGSWTMKSFGMFSVIERSSGQWIGRVGPWSPEGWPGPEVGWGLLPAHWGRGYATEAADVCVDWAFDNLGWTEVIHIIDERNLPSRRVAERLGSRYLRQGRLPDLDLDLQVWGQSREDWQGRRA